MKTFACFILFIVVSLSAFAQSLTIDPIVYVNGRAAVGAGTFITNIPIFAAHCDTIHGFQMKIKRTALNPQSFYLSGNFYGPEHYWDYDTYLNDTSLDVGAVGNKIKFGYDFQLGSIELFVSPDSKESEFLEFSLFDGKTQWATSSGVFKVIKLPFKRYGDNNNDGLGNITDVMTSYDLMGTVSDNDTTNLTNDVDGNGQNGSYDMRLQLQAVVHPEYRMNWPIFRCYTNVIGKGKVVPTVSVKATWRKMSNGRWGLYSPDSVLNGDLVSNNTSLKVTNSSWIKPMANKVYFVNRDYSPTKPILEADAPIQFTGTVNNGQPVIIETATGVEEKIINPTSFILEQNYPNPFNPSTTISYQLPNDGLVSLKVYDVLGKEVATLVNEQKSAGKYEVKFDASKLTSGTYIYKISAGSSVQIKKMILMK